MGTVESQTGIRTGSTARERARATKPAPPRKSSSSRPSSPTRSIEPGFVHEQVAGTLLNIIHVNTGLNVGEIPESKVAGTDSDDPQRLARITSHMVARVFDRIPGLRKLSRQAEGVDRKSGLVSDAVAAFAEIYRQNPERFQELGNEVFQSFKAKREAAIAAKANSNNQSPNGGVTNAAR